MGLLNLKLEIQRIIHLCTNIRYKQSVISPVGQIIAGTSVTLNALHLDNDLLYSYVPHAFSNRNMNI